MRGCPRRFGRLKRRKTAHAALCRVLVRNPYQHKGEGFRTRHKAS